MIRWSRGDRRKFHISSSIITASCIKVFTCTCQKPGRDLLFGLYTTQYPVNGPDCWASVTLTCTAPNALERRQDLRHSLRSRCKCVTDVSRTNVLGIADGDLRPPQLITDGDSIGDSCHRYVRWLLDAASHEMSPQLRGVGRDKASLAQLF